MKKTYLASILILVSNYCFSQTIKEFLFTPVNEELFIPENIVQNGKYLELTFENESIHQLFSESNVVEFQKAFPKLKSYLNTVYLVRVEDSDFTVSNLIKNEYIIYGEEIESPSLASGYPNDYILPDGLPNDYLELIRAPLAWSVTKGNPNISIGIADSWFNTVHEELNNKFTDILGPQSPAQGNYNHGIEVSSLAAGNTNNGVGLSSIGYNTKMVGYVGLNSTAVYQLALKPNVKVINMSWGSLSYSQYLDDLYTEIRDDLNIVLVAAAHNGKYYDNSQSQFSYHYPASYDAVISVTGVGSKYNRGITNVNGIATNWKDVALYHINNPESTMTVNDKVNVAAPSYDIFRATNTNGFIGSTNTYTSILPGTSMGAPIVSGLAALILAANPNLSATKVKQIIEETTDNIYQIPENAPFIGKLGTGRINAYRAVMRADCLLKSNKYLDLMIRDNKEDFGIEPNLSTKVYWNSNDIWVRNQDDDIEDHQNPIYNAGKPNFVYVRVFNKSCLVSSGLEKIKVYWSKASTSLEWDGNWNGQNSFPNNGPLLGAPVGELTIPVLEPGQDIVLKLPWSVPDPKNYQPINNDPWHFCLLARIVSTDDSMTFTESRLITDNVKNNNNIAQKNLTIIDLDPNNNNTPIGGVIAVGNPLETNKKYNLKFEADFSIVNSNIFNEAEVSVILDSIVFKAWEKGGFKGVGVKNIGNKIVITDNNAEIQDLDFKSKELGTVGVNFHFLTKENTNQEKFLINVIQQFSDTKETIGGETYEVRKYPRDLFYAQIVNNVLADKNKLFLLEANPIEELAVYNWYDSEDNLLYQGLDFETSVEFTTKYKLEVVSLEDGFKDYAEIEIGLKPDNISSFYPNPADDHITVDYNINKGNSAYLSVISTYGSLDSNNISNNYILDIEKNAIQLDISQYPSGIYTIVLISDGQIADSKKMIKE